MKSESEASREAPFAPIRERHYLIGMQDKPKRPRDANQLAKFIVDVATGEVDEKPTEETQQKAAGSLGGATRASRLSKEKRSKIAKKAADARWAAPAPPSEEG